MHLQLYQIFGILALFSPFRVTHHCTTYTSGVDWYCDSCDAYLNKQPGFTTSSGSWTCAHCASENDVTADNILSVEEAEVQESFQNDCPKCGGHMARGNGLGNWWVCEECGAEAEDGPYGNLWTET